MEQNMKNLINDIKTNLTQKSASIKDEVRVMQCMMNDKEYTVDVYGNEGVEGTYCPSADARAMFGSVLAGAAKINTQEAADLMDNYTFSRSQAASMVGISKEFIHTYLETGRKLPLGGREDSNISLLKKEVKAGYRTIPVNNQDGTATRGTTFVPAHGSIKVYSPCPTHLKETK